MAATAMKICTICNTDCADRPRVKDEFGRYTCKACVEKQEAKAAAKVGGAKVAPPKAGEDDELDLRSAAMMEAKSAAMDLPEAQCCPKCNGFMPNDQRLCMRCGFDRKRGAKVMTRVEKVKEVKEKRRSAADPMSYIGPGIAGVSILLGALSFINPEIGAVGFMVNVVLAIAVGLTVRICQARDGDWVWFILGWVVGVTDFIWVLMNERAWLKFAFFGILAGLILGGVANVMNGGLGAGE